MLKERVELLAIGEAIGYPRLGIGHRDGKKLAIKAGQPGWEQFCGHAHTTRIPAALRIGRILRDNGVTPYNPPRGDAHVVTPQVVEENVEEPQPEMTVGLDLVESFFDPKPDEMVKPKRSSAAIRQARWREKQKQAHA
jgi:hypothetical protein